MEHVNSSETGGADRKRGRKNVAYTYRRASLTSPFATRLPSALLRCAAAASEQMRAPSRTVMVSSCYGHGWMDAIHIPLSSLPDDGQFSQASIVSRS